MTTHDEMSKTILTRRTVAFGDCDPAGIVYTPRLVAICLEAIDEAWKAILDGDGWFELTADHGRGSPFVSIAMEFMAPVTPRTALDLVVRLSKVGQTSLTFEVVASQYGNQCCKGTFTSVVVDLKEMRKVRPDDWVVQKMRAWAD